MHLDNSNNDIVASLSTSADSNAQRLRNLLGTKIVLVPIKPNSKVPAVPGWPKFTLDTMKDPEYLAKLEAARTLGVVAGKPSSGICSIDIDHDCDVEPFLELNPLLRASLQTKGSRGCNIWVQLEGQYPDLSKIVDDSGAPFGEWRSTGGLTIIHGEHPSGVDYRVVSGSGPAKTRFDEIQWPDGLLLPWVQTPEEVQEELERRFGPPAIVSKRPDGKMVFEALNEAFWAGHYATENIVIFEPDESEFFQYDAETGLFVPVSTDSIKCSTSSSMLEASRKNQRFAKLANHRSSRELGAIVSQLRGIAEKRGAFSKPSTIIHLRNCVLRINEGEIHQCEFSPDFLSRNRSPIAFDPDARCPRFLGELLEPAVHPEDVILIQKFVGQCLLGINLIQRILMLVGLSARGKSQLANCIQQIVGMVNVTQLRTQHLHERFELFKFLRRTLLVGVDVDSDFLSSRGASVIKGLVGGDWFDAEKKGGSGSFQMQGCFNILLTSNCGLRVRLQGDDGAWRRRMIIVRYEAPPPKKRIPNFADVLIREEGSGILNWAIEGIQGLLRDIDEIGDIRLTERQSAIVDSLLDASDSLRAFLSRRVGKSPGGNLTGQEIIQAYADFCPEMDWDTLPDAVISKQLPDLMLELFQAAKAHDIRRDGTTQRGFRNVALK